MHSVHQSTRWIFHAKHVWISRCQKIPFDQEDEIERTELQDPHGDYTKDMLFQIRVSNFIASNKNITGFEISFSFTPCLANIPNYFSWLRSSYGRCLDLAAMSRHFKHPRQFRLPRLRLLPLLVPERLPQPSPWQSSCRLEHPRMLPMAAQLRL